MAFEVPSDFPNILLIIDSNIYISGGGVNRNRLAEYLRTPQPGCPVRRNSHDFWITHPTPRGGTDYSGPTDNASPRPFRGIIRLGLSLDSFDAASASQYLGSFLHEVGHYWLVPSDLRIRGELIKGAVQFMRAVQQGRQIPQHCILGRSGGHWSSYIAAGISMMDGIDWQEQEVIRPDEGVDTEESRLRRYTIGTAPGTTVTVPGIMGTVRGTIYSDLDKTIMGIITPDEAYPDRENSFDEIAPQWISPLDFQAGLALAFSNNDIIYFGFNRSFQTIKAVRTGQVYPQTFDLSSFYRPWSFEMRMLLRIIKRGNDYHFQVRPEEGRVGCLGVILEGLGLWRPTRVDPFSDMSPISGPDASPSDWWRWNTLLTINESAPPRGVGYIVTTWGVTPTVDVNFRDLQIQDDSGRRSINSVSAPTSDSNYLNGMSSSTLTFHRPKLGPTLRPGRGIGNIVISGSLINAAGNEFDHIGTHNHWIDVDEAPKLMTSAPANNQDFAVAGSVRIDRAIMVPWAAGDLFGRTMWGYRRRVPMRSLTLNPNGNAARRNPDGPYKAAFMIVAARREDISDTMIRNVDRMRQACEELFRNATGGRRSLYTLF